MTFERETIENIILKMRASKPFETTQLRILDCPVEKTSGDVLLSAYRADKTRHVLIGDFTGMIGDPAGPVKRAFDGRYSRTGDIPGRPAAVAGLPGKRSGRGAS